MYQPKTLKPKKSHKGKNFRKIASVISLNYGSTQLISLETGILTSKHFKVIKNRKLNGLAKTLTFLVFLAYFDFTLRGGFL